MDLLALRIDNDPAFVEQLVIEIASVDVDDGVVFLLDTTTVTASAGAREARNTGRVPSWRSEQAMRSARRPRQRVQRGARAARRELADATAWRVTWGWRVTTAPGLQTKSAPCSPIIPTWPGPMRSSPWR